MLSPTQTAALVKQFQSIGAALVIQPPRGLKPYDLNVRLDRKHGEHFTLALQPDAPDIRVLHADRADRHLVLHIAGETGGERFLCGHDERHWFAAAIGKRVTTVLDAKRALLPEPLADAPPAIVQRRHNARFMRQGEWFFVPTDRDFGDQPIHRNEPIVRRRGGKPHHCAELLRFGGEPVVIYKGKEYDDTAWAAFVTEPGRRLTGRVERMVKNPEVYVRGPVRHPDHATLVLRGWHRLYGNLEAVSVGLSFYD